MGMAQKDVEKPQGGWVHMMTPLSLPRLSSCTAETGKLKCMILRSLSGRASLFDLGLNVTCFGLRFATQRAVKAALLLHMLFLLRIMVVETLPYWWKDEQGRVQSLGL